MPSDTITIAGFELIEQRPTHDAGIEHWIAQGMGRPADVYTLPLEYRERLSGLPNIVGFTQWRLIEEQNQLYVIMPGRIEVSVSQLRKKFGAEVCVGVLWHIADLLGLLHQSGRAHNLLHADSIGLNDLGELEIRPALGRFIVSDPDPKATAIATDCWQIGPIMKHLGIDESMDPLFGLLKRGLQEEYARLRLQPATAVRQSIAAVWARHPEWELKFIDAMGGSWALNQRSLEESTVLPHRLSDLRPKMSINDIRDLPESIDLWGNLFNSSSIDEASSSQALLMEALSARKNLKTESTTRIVLPSHKEREDVVEEPTARLQIELQTSPIQVSVQQRASRSSAGLVSIQEVGLEDEVSPALPEDEERYFQGLAAIVEETADNLEVLHRKRRRSLSKSMPKPPSVLPPPVIELSTEAPLHRIVEEIEEHSAVVQPVTTENEESEDVEVGGQTVDFSDVEFEENVEDSTVLKVEPVVGAPSEPEPVSVDVNTQEEPSVEVSEPSEVEDATVVVSLKEETPVSKVEASLSVESSTSTIENVQETLTSSESIEPEWTEVRTDSPVENLVDEEVSSDVHHHDHRAVDEVLDNSVGDTVVDAAPLVADADLVESDSFEPTEILSGSVSVELELSVEPEISIEDSSVEIPTTALVPSVSTEEEPAQENVESAFVSESDGQVQVSIANMPLISIVEEYSEEETGGTVQEGVDVVEQQGARIELVMEEPALEVSDEGLNAVFEPTVDLNTSTTPTYVETASEEGGFVAELSEAISPMARTEDALDVEEPLADIEFPSIEEVKANDSAFAGDVNALFDASPVVDTRVEPAVNVPTVNVQSTTPSVFEESEPMVPAEPMTARPTASESMEPKWTGASAFDNLSNEEDALGDEKYAFEQVELGDVDAVLGESIRDISELEKRGSPIGLLLIVGLVLIFGIVYALNPQDSVDSVVEEGALTEQQDLDPVVAQESTIKIQTNPPQGRVYIENQELGVAPLDWEMTEGDQFMMCVDWGSNPICRRVSRSEFGTEYTFVRKQTP